MMYRYFVSFWTEAPAQPQAGMWATKNSGVGCTTVTLTRPIETDADLRELAQMIREGLAAQGEPDTHVVIAFFNLLTTIEAA